MLVARKTGTRRVRQGRGVFEALENRRLLSAIHGVVFNDGNANGRRDEGEAGIPNVQVYLDTNRDSSRQDGERIVNTDATGRFGFGELAAGNYLVRQVPKAGLTQTFPANGAGNEVVLGERQEVFIQFGNRSTQNALAAIRGVVYHDGDGDGVRDEGEPGMGGVAVYIDADNDSVRDPDEKTSVSQWDGRYGLEGLAAGTYRVREVVPQGFVQTAPAGGVHEVVLTAGQQAGERHFGNRRVEQPPRTGVVGVVFHDLDGDGVREHGEPPMGGVKVFIDTNLDGDADEGEPATLSGPDGGFYSFTNLPAGEHRVREVVPTGFVATLPPTGFYDVTLTSGQVVERHFGNDRVEEPPTTGHARGVVFHDVDGDGRRDDGEPGQGGVVVYLDADNDGVRDEGERATLSQSDGRYAFEGLAPGQYHVREIVPQGFTRTVPTSGVYDITIVAGQTVGELVFGNRRNDQPTQGSLRGVVFEDRDGDGVRDDGEPGLGGRVLFLDTNRDGDRDEGEKATISQSDGRYAFEGLAAGEYQVRESVPAGFVLTVPREGFYNVTLAAGQSVSGLNFGNRRTEPDGGGITGVVFADLNADGDRDDGEFGLGGVTLYLDADRDGVRDEGERTTFSTNSGEYFFRGLPAGEYRVREIVPRGWALTVPVGGFYEVVVVAGETVGGRNFGNRRVEEPRQASIRGVVFNDLDGDGVRDTNEPGLGRRVLYIDADRDGVRDEGERATISNDDGRYAFENLAAGEYRVRESVPAGWTLTVPTSGFYDVTLNAGQQVGERHFGNRRTEPPTGDAMISGLVYNDVDADGVRDDTEAGIGGVRVYLDANNNGRPDSGERNTLTSNTGAYAFTNLPAGTYRVREVRPEGARITAPPEGVHVIELAAGGSATGADFGNTRKALIRGVVFDDVNADRQRQTGEAGLSGWTVFLDLDRDGTPDDNEPTTETNAEGRYSFLIDGNRRYRVREVVEEGYRPTTGVFSDLFVRSGQVLTRNFGNTTGAVLAGGVFNDLDGDGERDDGERGLAGRTVFLDADDDGVLDETERRVTTGETGRFHFGSLADGRYVVRLLSTEGAEITTPEGGAYTIEDLASGEVVEGLIFGERRIEDDPTTVA